jgi:hypothetical protein
VIIGLRPPPEKPQRRWARPFAIALAVLVAGVVVVWAVLPPIEALVRGSEHGSGVGAGPGCLMPTVSAPAISDDEQLYMAQSGNSSAVTFHVRAVTQTDSNGYGPGYLVNGITAAGYWYQVGIVYDWPCGSGYISGFHFFSEVWGPGDTPVLGPIAAPVIVGGGDSVNLTLRFHGSSVVMSASDPMTGMNQSSIFPAENSTVFVGGPVSGWFTGAMTEWYHSQAYYGGELPVNYTAITPIAGNDTNEVTLGIDEIALPASFLFDQTYRVAITCSCYYPFSYEGGTAEVGPDSFQSGA